MTRTLLVLSVGLLGGLGAHLAYFQAHRPCTQPTLACELAWIRDELGLNQEQFALLTQLHEMTEPGLLDLADQLAEMRGKFEAFETRRKEIGQIDFIEFSQFLADQHLTRNAYENSTRSLVEASASLMRPEQRRRYLALVGLEAGDFPDHSL